MKRTIAVLGLSVFGRQTALGLAGKPGIDVIVFDHREDAIEEIAPEVTRAVVADIRNTQVLEKEGARGWHAAVLGIRSHFEAAVLVTHYLKRKAGVPTVAVQVNSRDEEEAIRVLGADLIVFPERDSAKQMVKTIANPRLTQFFDLGRDVDVAEVRVPEQFVGKTLSELDFRRKFDLQVVAIKQPVPGTEGDDYETEIPPRPNRPLREGALLMVLGRPEQVDAFVEEHAVERGD